MTINDKAITGVIGTDVGRPVTYQISGMRYARHGWIEGLSTIPGKVFVSFMNDDANVTDRLVDCYNLRWGHVDGWV